MSSRTWRGLLSAQCSVHSAQCSVHSAWCSVLGAQSLVLSVQCSAFTQLCGEQGSPWGQKPLWNVNYSLEFTGFSMLRNIWQYFIMTYTVSIGKSEENNSSGYQCFLFSRKRNPRMKESDEVSDPTFSLTSVSSSLPGGHGAFLLGRFLRLSFMQTSSCLRLLSQAVRGYSLPTMFLHLPNWILFWATSVLISHVMWSQLTTKIITYLFWSNRFI